jgi:anti-sigma regulatory factor (Ser/Thr protein kinase)
MAVALTVMLIAGTFYEEQDKQALKKIVRISMNYNVLINTALSVLIFAFAPYWVSLYEKIGSQTHDMTVYCLRWTAVGLSFCAVNEYFMYFMMGTGKHKQVHILTFFQRFIYMVGCAFALGLIFGVKGVFASFAVAEICFTVHVVVYIWVKNKKFPTSMEQFMLLPEDFGAAPDMTLDCSVCSMDEVIGISKTVMDFCKERGMDQRRAGYAALCVEEIAGNVARHAARHGKPATMDLLVLNKPRDVVICIRDNQRMFDPVAYLKENASVDKHFGIRLAQGVTDGFEYHRTIGLNNVRMVIHK